MQGLQLRGEGLYPVILGHQAGALQPAQQNLRCTGIRDCSLSQTTFDSASVGNPHDDDLSGLPSGHKKGEDVMVERPESR